MRELLISEIENVSGGNPAAIEGIKQIGGNLLWTSLLAGLGRMTGNGNRSSGGQMNRSRRYNVSNKKN